MKVRRLVRRTLQRVCVRAVHVRCTHTHRAPSFPQTIIRELLHPRTWKPPEDRSFLLDAEQINELCDVAERIFRDEPSVLQLQGAGFGGAGVGMDAPQPVLLAAPHRAPCTAACAAFNTLHTPNVETMRRCFATVRRTWSLPTLTLRRTPSPAPH